MPTTYEPISTTTLSAGTASVTFSSIPQTYTDLVLVVNAKSSGASGSNPTFLINSDSGSNYSYSYIYGDGTTAGTFRLASNTKGILGLYSGNLQSGNFSYNSITHFMNYSNTSINKSVLSRSNDANLATEFGINLYRSTSAITSITAQIATVTFTSGSTFTLYGIKAA
jgi:hypothetical protein